MKFSTGLAAFAGIVAIAGAIFSLTALPGCAPSKTDISSVFSYNFSLINPPTGTLSFDDKDVRFTFSPERDYMKVVFINKSAMPVKVFWKEALYVDKYGLSHTLVTKDAGHEDSDSNGKKPREPATIAPGAQLTEWLVPRDNIRPGLIGSRVEPMFPRLSNPEIIDSWDRTAFKVTLPMEVNGEAKTYEFEFRVKTR